MATYFKFNSLNKNMQLLNCFLSYHKLTLLELSTSHFQTVLPQDVSESSTVPDGNGIVSSAVYPDKKTKLLPK